MTRIVLILLVWMLAGTTQAAEDKTVDIAVQGMSCPFCVYNVEKKLNALDGVSSARVDLAQGRARVVMQPGNGPSDEQLRQAITDAGFTPGDIVSPAVAPEGASPSPAANRAPGD